VFAFLALAELVALPAFSLMYATVDGRTIAAVVLADIGISAVGTLVGAMAVAGRARELLLPLLFLPLAIPIVVGGVEASVRGRGDAHDLLFLVLYDGVFVLLSWASFEYVVTET
jgi:ABC-type transport system involved in cytochrome c biogenesis permease component